MFYRLFNEYLNDNLSENSIGVEIGTWKGDNVNDMMAIKQIKKLYIYHRPI